MKSDFPRSAEEINNTHDVDLLIRSGYELIEEGKQTDALHFFSRAIEQDSKAAAAYLGRFVAEYNESKKEGSGEFIGVRGIARLALDQIDKLVCMMGIVKTFDEIRTIPVESLLGNPDVEKALRYADGEFREKIEDLLIERIYQEGCKNINGWSRKGADCFGLIPGYKDADELYKESLYAYGSGRFSANGFEDAYDAFSCIPEYKDAQEKLNECTLVLGGKLAKHKKYQEAVDLLTPVKGYKNADDIIAECEQKLAAAGEHKKFSLFR